MRHGAGDIVRYGNSINMSCEAPETGHKDWIKGQGGKTNQGPAVQLSMMLHTLRKEASATLCDAVQGMFLFASYIMQILHSLTYFAYFANSIYFAYFSPCDNSETFAQPGLTTMIPDMRKMTGLELIDEAEKSYH